MNSIFKTIFTILFLLPVHLLAEENSSSTNKELTLQDVYELSLKQSESLQRKVQDIKVAEAKYREAIAAVYPNIHFINSERIRNSDSVGFGSSNSNSNTSDSNGSTGSSSRTNSKNQFEGSVNLKQPLFSGFRESLLADAVKSEITALQFDVGRAKELLYLDVADVFHQTIFYAGDLEILKKTSHVLNQRIEALNKFIQLGKSREGEILAAKSDLADLQVTRDQVQGLLNASKEMLSFLTGLQVADLKLREASDITPVMSLDTYITQVRGRRDLRAATERRKSIEKQLISTKRENWPSLSFEGNYYPYQSPDTDRDWDILFKIDLPLFEGGAIAARVDKQQALLESSGLVISELQRSSERDVKIAFKNYESAKAVAQSLRQLVDTSHKNFESQRQDYELGVVTNLEVLQAIKQMQDAERRLLEAQTNLRVDLVRLNVSAGGL